MRQGEWRSKSLLYNYELFEDTLMGVSGIVVKTF